jgi:hypothetical protein
MGTENDSDVHEARRIAWNIGTDRNASLSSGLYSVRSHVPFVSASSVRSVVKRMIGTS